MRSTTKKKKVGIIGCGSIGSGIAKSILTELKDQYVLSALYDVDPKRSVALAKKFKNPKVSKKSIPELLKVSDLVVEAVSSDRDKIIEKALKAKKEMLVMSIGALLIHPRLLNIAKKNKCRVLIPSGAIAGLDALKSVAGKKLEKLVLTTRKPPKGLMGSPYLERKKISLKGLKGEFTVFEGNVTDAVKAFPQNINVAAALALACNAKSKLKIRILTSPKFKRNSHSIEASGSFGRITTQTENVACPDNPKTSYLAVLSAISTLKQNGLTTRIGS